MPKKTKYHSVSEKKKPKKEPVAIAAEKDKAKKIYHLLRGMHDILPKDEKYWQAFYNNAQQLAIYFQFNKIETPLLEEANLFIRSVGRGTDIVDKEMYIFEDRDGAKVALRPEFTASIVRSYITHGMWNSPQPVKLFSWGPLFRHNRPQAGRYREFFQANFEVLGAKDPAIDAELMLTAYNIYAAVGLPVEIRLNNIGSAAERERYVAELTNYYRAKRSYLCDDCRTRLNKNPLRLLDCKEEQCRPVRDEAPQIVDWLDEASRNYFMKTLEFLDELEIPYILSSYLVRGMDYYTGTVFEIYPAFESTPVKEGGNKDEPAAIETAQSALGGGGRYDVLVEEMGGRPTPAAGFALGIERSIAALKQYKEKNPINVATPAYDVYFAQLGEDGKRRALKLINDLKNSGLKIAFNFFKNSLKAQLEAANSMKVPLVLILGQKEVQDQTVIIRDMESGVQETVGQKKMESVLKKKLNKQ